MPFNVLIPYINSSVLINLERIFCGSLAARNAKQINSKTVIKTKLTQKEASNAIKFENVIFFMLLFSKKMSSCSIWDYFSHLFAGQVKMTETTSGVSC